MLKRRKINEKFLADTQPSLKEKQNTSTGNFCKELELFSDGYLRGAVNLYTRQVSSGVLSISLEYFAYFLRLMLEATANIGSIDMYVDIRNIAAISFKFDSTLINDDLVRRLFKVAMRAGFICARNEEVLLLETAIHQDRCLAIRANNSLHFYRILEAIILKSEDANITKRAKKH